MVDDGVGRLRFEPRLPAQRDGSDPDALLAETRRAGFALKGRTSDHRGTDGARAVRVAGFSRARLTPPGTPRHRPPAAAVPPP
ncbi:DUF6461 domain-containing protein [Streptomyces sp. NPDC052109]|uniref:DUF6461 domain-containing protein n=1 Tax=Streptomyces sp. NPDC052109 TaxID=3155527 RepID=UPI003437930E